MSAGTDLRRQHPAALATWAASAQSSRLPERVRRRASLVFADSIGVMLRGSCASEVQRLAAATPEAPGARLLAAGTNRTAERDSAAFVNAVALCSIEMDEGSRPSGHPGLHVIPPALAEAQAGARSGADFLTALVVGYEVQARLQWATALKPAVHPHGNLGLAGASAALGWLRGFTPEQMEHTLNVAAALVSATSWTPALTGATVRNAYAAQSCATAFRVAALVESGFTGHPQALSETFGTMLGDGFDATELDRELGAAFHITDNYFKFHSACALVHPVLDALATALGSTPAAGRFPLLRIDPVEADQVTGIEVFVPERSQKLNIKNPINALDARFSIPFAIGAFLTFGHTGPESFEGAALTLSAPRDVAAKVTVTGCRQMSTRWPEELVSSVVVSFADGTSRTGECVDPVGSKQKAVTEENLFAKFEHLVRGTETWSDARDCWENLLAVDTLDDVSELELPRY